MPRDEISAKVQKRIKTGSEVLTDEHTGCEKLDEVGYDHAAVNHAEGKYATGPDGVRCVQPLASHRSAGVVDGQAP